MTREEFLNRKQDIEEKIKKCKTEYDILNTLRTECDRIDIVKNLLVIEENNLRITINKNTKKVKKISFYNEKTKKIENFSR